MSDNSTASCILKGRFANNLYQAAHTIAYALEHNMRYHIPIESPHCPNGIRQFDIVNTGELPPDKYKYNEITKNGHPYYIEIPRIHNPLFEGYWQSFRYLDNYRNQLLDIFNFNYSKIENTVAIHVRRGDYVKQHRAFPCLPLSYYMNAINWMLQLLGEIPTFIIFSDDIEWSKMNFTEELFGIKFNFSEGKTDKEDFELMSNCEHQIIANSSYSFLAAWFNRNMDKYVICPDFNNLFAGCNIHMIPEYFIQIKP